MRVAAVDLGASSGRVSVAQFSSDGFSRDPFSGDGVELTEVHRFPNIAVRAGGTLRWDVLGLLRGTLDGLRAAGRFDSVGVDSWGVDYGLLDADGDLLGNPVCYREPGTDPAVAAVLTALGPSELYAATGIQMQPFNTLFQLMARQDTAQAGIARRALLIPDLMTYWLSGAIGTEITNASTTALLDPRTLDWSPVLADRLKVPVDLFGPLTRPGDRGGTLREDLGFPHRAEVVTVPSHDTAAAVAGIPADGDDFAFVCTGTWALVGVELPAPVITEEGRRANFTNEVGVDGTIRYLRNVTGFWLMQECVRHWRGEGAEVDVPSLVGAAADVPGLRAVIDVQDPAFAVPGDMPRRIREAAARTSGATIDSYAETARCILDSMALAIRHAVRDAVTLSGRSVRVLHVVGGGVESPLFCQVVADACGLPVLAGPTEAASWGNVMSQARALGAVGDSLAESRALIRRSAPPVRYEPGPAGHASAASGPAAGSGGWERADGLVPGGRR